MQIYNKIMLYFWLAIAVVTFFTITYCCITDNWKTWVFYYIFPFLAVVMFLFKRWMMNRMKKHLEYLKNQAKN